MSGLVAALSREQGTGSTGPSSLALLTHLPAYRSSHVALDGIWMGVTGWPWSASLAVSGGAADGGGAHPMLAAMVAGVIVNRRRLAGELGLVASDGQADLALAAYRAWGARLFDRLEGSFALVVHDVARGLTLAGTDPDQGSVLHLTRLGDDVLLATEAKAFFADPRFSARLDPQAFADLVTLGHGLGPSTLFEGVRRVPHGSHLEIEHDEVRVVRHWKVEDLLGAHLRGGEYVDHLAATIRELTREAFDGQGIIFPLTGGVDSRLIAAAAPAWAHPLAFTFGTGEDADSVRGRQIARARSFAYHVESLDPEYLVASAATTVWLTEGQLNPSANLTGSLMERFAPGPYFVTGIGGDLGRRYYKARHLLPFWSTLEGGDALFERRFLDHEPTYYGLPRALVGALFPHAGDELIAAGRADLLRSLEKTRGLPVVDRLDLYSAEEATPRAEVPQLTAAMPWLDVCAPLLTRRWIEAVLRGAASERIDDLVRLRLIRDLDLRVAMVPWTLTRLPLPASEPLVQALRVLARARDVRPESSAGGPAGAPNPLLQLKELIYSHGEQHDEWLRGPSRAFLTDLLLSGRLADRGLVRIDAVRELVDEHMRGADNSDALGHLLNIELWHRLFVDERPVPRHLPSPPGPGTATTSGEPERVGLMSEARDGDTGAVAGGPEGGRA